MVLGSGEIEEDILSDGEMNLLKIPCGAWCIYEGRKPVACEDPLDDFFSGRTISLVVPRYLVPLNVRIDMTLEDETVAPRCLVNIGSYKTLSPTTLRRRIRYLGGRKARRARARLREYDKVWAMINRHFARTLAIDIVKFEMVGFDDSFLDVAFSHSVKPV